MNAVIKNIRFNEKDISLFRYLYFSKVANVDQINRDIYRYANTFSLYKRLKLLTNRGLIQSRFSPAYRGRKTVSLTKKGFNTFISDGTEQRIELTSDAVEHDLALVDIRNIFCSMRMVEEYYTENYLQTWYTKCRQDDLTKFTDVRCDAVATLNIEDSLVNVAIEFERTQKAHTRIFKIIQRYYESPVPAIFYILSDRTLLRKFHKQEKLYLESVDPNQDSKIFYICLDDFLSAGEVTFKKLNGKTFVLGNRILTHQ